MNIKTALLTVALSACTLGAAAHAQEATQVPPPAPSSVTREEVKADLRAWRQAGLDELWRGENTPDIYSAEYRRRFAAYQALRGNQRADSDRQARGNQS